MEETTKPAVALDGELWLSMNGLSLAGLKRIELLEHIAACGSITQAARRHGISYKNAWDIVDIMNNMAGEPLVERSTGGKGGGGTRLTAAGLQLIATFRQLETEHRRFLQSLGTRLPGIADSLPLLRRLAMKTSARNQFFGTVRRLTLGAINDEVEIELKGGDRLVAVITHESTERLGIRVGGEAIALVKAPWIIVMTDDAGVKLSARNRLAGEVVALAPGAVNTEVTIKLAGGTTVSAIITSQSATELGLAVGKSASAVFKASHIIVGVPE
ncbi:TOBE domain-containing protein [Paludibacterium yongneupense]|uniref:TOBE domain-containing protein n=1 Tax=Paludibacterium yongneupense TaxID=400061 RepID=UPI0003F71527|nr:TOBE domain-containing protein [Paludibacterium yongneupense]